MADFGMEISGDRAAVLRFDKVPAAAHDRLLAALTDIEQRLETAVLAAEPNRSGALRAITCGKVYDHGSRIAAVVGVRAPDASTARKAATLEYGSRLAAITMRAHTARLSHIYRRAIAEITVNVPSHRRTPNVPAQRFLRGPIEAIRPGALEEMRAALAQAVADVESA